METPTGHQVIMPYLILTEAAEFIEFTKKVFNAELTQHKMREDGTTIMHAEATIDGSTIMFCDSAEGWAPSPANLFIYVSDADETYHRAIESGASTVMELNDQEYGRTCGVQDSTGNVWWITSITT